MESSVGLVAPLVCIFFKTSELDILSFEKMNQNHCDFSQYKEAPTYLHDLKFSLDLIIVLVLVKAVL
jgi:hypothetical protein